MKLLINGLRTSALLPDTTTIDSAGRRDWIVEITHDDGPVGERELRGHGANLARELAHGRELSASRVGERSLVAVDRLRGRTERSGIAVVDSVDAERRYKIVATDNLEGSVGGRHLRG